MRPSFVRGELGLARAVVQAEGGARGLDVPLEKRPFERQLVRLARRALLTSGGTTQSITSTTAQAIASLRRPGEHQHRGQQRRAGFTVCMRQSDILLHIIDPDHQVAVIGEQKIVAAQPEIRREHDQENGGQTL